MTDDLQVLSTMVRGRYGRVHEHHEEIGSTNDRALAWLREGTAPHGTVITADRQTAGRGRRGRSWQCAPGDGLLVSVILRPGSLRDPQRFGALGLAVAVGLRAGLPTFDPPVALKWPNDLLVGGRKLGGILCEARWVGDAPEVVVGFGINVRPGAIDPTLADVATSLHSCGAALGRASVLVEVLHALEQTLEPFFARGFGAVRDDYLAACETLGRPVAVGDMQRPQLARRAIAERLDDDGALWVRTEDGEALRVESADVWLVPPSA